jgi:hypothetical protein
MKDETDAIHRQLVDLGEALGFVSSREVSKSVLSLRLNAAYRPHIDLMWSLPLNLEQRQAIGWAIGLSADELTHLPVVGMEVEGTTPTTKTLQADVANLLALGAPLGLLAITESGEKGIYARAARAIRTLRRTYGDVSVVPLEAGWLADLAKTSWPAGMCPSPGTVAKGASGGETLAWGSALRKALRQRGEAAGFTVVEPYEPAILGATYAWARESRTGGLWHTTDPLLGHRREMKRAGDYLTGSKIDMAWLLPLPKALGAFLAAVEELDPGNREHGLVFSDLWTHCAVVAFELESSAGKHAAGGLLNLAAYSVLGVAAVPNAANQQVLQHMLLTYQPTLGLRNVYVRKMEV